MNTKQFNAALALAQSQISLTDADDSALFGCGLPGFQPVHVTLAAVARHIRYQCQYLSGNWDAEEIAQCKHILVTLRRAIVTDSGLKDCIRAEVAAIAAEGEKAVKNCDFEGVERAAYKARAFAEYMRSLTDKAVNAIRSAATESE